ncbi:MAG: ABC-type phosphate transport system substrate-binding protein [Candidatus Krumholzibacteriia bacterium]|jgi:ABC-type phosphate transport system substrate-binding protein
MNRTFTIIALTSLWLSLLASEATSSVVVVVAADSKIDELDLKTTQKIFLGKVAETQDGQDVVPVYYDQSSLTYREFAERLLSKTPGQLRAYWGKRIFSGRGRRPLTIDSVAELKAHLQENSRAISFLDEADIDETVRVLLVLE